MKNYSSFLKTAIQGTGKTFFVSDEEGAGKTTLIKEFLKEAREEGAITLTGRCLSKAAVPYFPFFEAFNSFCSQKKDFNLNILEKQNISNGSIQPEVISWLIGPNNQRN